MTGRRFTVGIVGLQPGRSWAARAHVPALRALPHLFDIAGVANTSLASAEAAASATGIPRAYANVAELVAAPEIDIVAVTVKVPHHLEIVETAIRAGKHVYCEWPLGNGLAQAETLAELAHAKGVLGVVGTQARVAPEIVHLRRLIREGYAGEVLSSTIVARGGLGGGILPLKSNAYLLDRRNGATMLTIPVGHSLAAIRDVLGDVEAVSSITATRRPLVQVLDSGETLPANGPDQVLVNALLAGGGPLSLHFRGGTERDGAGLLWEINGSRGDIRVTGTTGHMQMVRLTLHGARGKDRSFQPLAVPADDHGGWPDDVIPGNVARLYALMADDLRNGTATAPSFADAVKLHRIIAAIEQAAETGRRVAIANISPI